MCVWNRINCKAWLCFGVMNTDCGVCVCVFIKLCSPKKRVRWKKLFTGNVVMLHWYKCAGVYVFVWDLNRLVHVLTLLTLSPLHGRPASQLHQTSHSSTALSLLCINVSGRVSRSNRDRRKSEDKGTVIITEWWELAEGCQTVIDSLTETG